MGRSMVTRTHILKRKNEGGGRSKMNSRISISSMIIPCSVLEDHGTVYTGIPATSAVRTMHEFTFI
jgi:hypothetical protein